MTADASPRLRQTLAANLSRARAKAGLSVAACATAAGVHLDYWYKLERGEKWPGDDALARIAAAAGTTPEKLLRPEKKS